MKVQSRFSTRSRVLGAVAAVVVGSVALYAQKAIDRLDASAKVFHEIMSASDGGVPDYVLKRSQCIMIVPGLKKASFVIGGDYGAGVVTCRVKSGGWSAPLFISMGGGSFGFQLGAEETDLVMLIMNEDGEQYLLRDKFTLGGDMSVAAGPVGRDANAQTDAMMHAKMLAYSRSRGLFGGISLKGGVIKPDNDDNKWLYKSAEPKDILLGSVPRPEQANKLLAELIARAG